jgi:hypothetical protein
MLTADLHPYVPPGGRVLSSVSALRVVCAALPSGGLSLAYTLEGRIDALRIPVKDGPDAWPLWQHTCFEAFLALPGEQGYREYNFSPAGPWAASTFRRYREIERELAGDGVLRPAIETSCRSAALRLTAHLPPDLLPGGPILRAGLSAVIEHGDGQIEYWALRHPVVERADFHHQDGWTLRLDIRQVQPCY